MESLLSFSPPHLLSSWIEPFIGLAWIDLYLENLSWSSYLPQENRKWTNEQKMSWLFFWHSIKDDCISISQHISLYPFSWSIEAWIHQRLNSSLTLLKSIRDLADHDLDTYYVQFIFITIDEHTVISENTDISQCKLSMFVGWTNTGNHTSMSMSIYLSWSINQRMNAWMDA